MTGLTYDQDRAIQELVAQIQALSRRVARAERSHDAAIGLGVPVTDMDGNVVGSIGARPDAPALVEPDPVPPTPDAPEVETVAGVAMVALSGMDEAAELAPSTVVRTCVYASLEPGFEPSVGNLRVASAPVTGEVVLPVAAGVWHVRTVWVTRTGTESAPSAEVIVDIEPLVDTDDIEATLQTARDELAAAEAAWESARAALDVRADDADQALGSARDRLAEAERVLSPLPSRVEAAEQQALDAQAKANELIALTGATGRVWAQSEAPPAGLAYEWTGAPGASESVMRVDGVERWRNFATHGSWTQGWAMNFAIPGDAPTAAEMTIVDAPQSPSGKALRIEATGSGFALAGVVADSTTLGQRREQSIRMAASLVSSTTERDLVILAREPNLHQEYHRPPVVDQWDQWDTQIMIPAGEGSVTVQVGHEYGRRLAGDVAVIGAVMLVDPGYTGDYFDGNTPDERANDLWVRTTDHMAHVWQKGTGWTPSQDPAIQAAVKAAAEAKATAEKVPTLLHGTTDEVLDTVWSELGVTDRLLVNDQLWARSATLIAAAIGTLTVTEKATFAEAFAEQFWAKMAVITRLQAEQGWVGGALLKDASVTAEKIIATEALTAKVAQFLKVKAGMIEANAFSGQEFTGGIFTGALFQTHASPARGMKILNDGLHAWDDNGNETTRLDGVRNLLIGRLQTALYGQPQVVLAPLAETGNPSVFFSDNGSLTGTQAAIFLNADSSLVLRPNTAAGQNWVHVAGGGLRSLGTSGANSWAITHSGIFRGRQLELVEGLKSTTNMWAIDSVGNTNFNHTKIWQSLNVDGNANLNGNDVRLNNIPSASFNANLGWATNPSGRLYRLTSNRRIKANIRDLVWDEDALLSLRPRTWYDRSLTEYVLGEDAITDTEDGPVVDEQAARGAGLSRIPGLVAEEVAALGLTELATYDTDPDTGQRTLSGVNYDRLAAALIPILRGQREKIATLEDRVARLETLIGATTV